jgi:hypothetical protein
LLGWVGRSPHSRVRGGGRYREGEEAVLSAAGDLLSPCHARRVTVNVRACSLRLGGEGEGGGLGGAGGGGLGGADGKGEEALPAAAVTCKSGPARRASATGGQVPPRSVDGEEKAVALKCRGWLRAAGTMRARTRERRSTGRGHRCKCARFTLLRAVPDAGSTSKGREELVISSQTGRVSA